MLFSIITLNAWSQIVVDSNGKVKLANVFNVAAFYSTNCYITPDVNSTGYIGVSGKQFSEVRAQSHFASQVLLTSDSSLKQNVRTIEQPLNSILKLNGKKYDYKTEASDTIGSKAETEKKALLKKNKLGFIAQEVKEIVPEAVFYEKESDLHYIDYNAIIPLLVEAMKEQQATIEALEARIEKLEGSSAATKSATIGNTTSTNENPLANTATLAQNIPNPFTDNTRIGITLPETVKTARLYVYNMQGVQINSFNINERGATSVTIEGYTLQAGMYLYTLIADGKEVDTKKMILTK
jgi:hypothetical protein